MHLLQFVLAFVLARGRKALDSGSAVRSLSRGEIKCDSRRARYSVRRRAGGKDLIQASKSRRSMPTPSSENTAPPCPPCPVTSHVNRRVISTLSGALSGTLVPRSKP
eukprot:382255-Rhodomonas_salina.1